MKIVTFCIRHRVTTIMQEIPFSRQYELYVEMMLGLAQEIDFNEVLQMFTDGTLTELKLVMEELGTDVTAMLGHYPAGI